MTVIDITQSPGEGEDQAPDRQWDYLLKAVDDIKQGMAAFDGEDRLMAWNKAFESLHDYPKDFCHIGLPLHDMLMLKAERGDYADMGDNPEHYVKARIDAMRGPDKTAMEILDHKGNCVEMEISHTGDGGMVVFYKDITLRKQSEMSLWRKANFDELTGLANRNLFYDRLEQALHLARRQNKGLSVMFIDLDSFKQVNDTMGHAAGDEVLAAVSRRMSACLRQSDTAARLAGDEFAVLLTENSEAANVELVANKIIRMLAAEIPLSEGNAHITASIGAAIYPDHAENAEDLVAIADTAMYRAKKGGKNQFRLAQDD